MKKGLLNLDEIVLMAAQNKDVHFCLLDGKEYYVVDTVNRLFSIKGLNGVLTYENVFSYYGSKPVFFTVEG